MKISVLTPTCDRPAAFALAERWMATQTIQPEEWIVADGGQVPVMCTRGQVHLHVPAAPGARNFTANLARALDAVSGDYIVCWEDDEWYAPGYLTTMVAMLEWSAALIAGDDLQRYYNVPRRCWRIFEHTGASLSQTAFRSLAIPAFYAAIRQCDARQTYGVDAAFWNAIAPDRKMRARTLMSVGIKGLPGQPGLGIGHRPQGDAWQADPDGGTLRAWVGDAADVYTSLVEGVPAWR